ncbi:MAG: Ig-like domain-containing protein [Bacillota bacterium]
MKGKTIVILLLVLVVAVAGGFMLGSWYLNQDGAAPKPANSEPVTPTPGAPAASDTVRVVKVSPEGEGVDLPRIEITFDAVPKDPKSVEDGFSVVPQTAGTFTWQDQTLIFTPSQALRKGTLYTVHLEADGVIPGVDGRWVDGKRTTWSFVPGGGLVGAVQGIQFYGAGYQVARLGSDGAAQVDVQWPSDKSLDDAVWSPDGSRVLFQSGFLFTFDVNTRQVDQLIGLEQGEPEPYHAAWSPDGKSVAFQRAGKVYTLSLSRGASPKALGGSYKGAVYPAWSSDGGWVAIHASQGTSGELWIAPVGGGKASRVADRVGGLRPFAWSPSGASLAYIRGSGNQAELHIYDVSTSRDLQVAPVPAGQLFWSPDGARLAIRTGNESGELWTVAAGGQDVTPVARNVRGGQGTVAWSPSGAYLAYVDSKGQVWRVRADGDGARQLSSGSESWSLLRWTAE